MVAAKAEKVAAKAAERKRAGSNPSKENRRVACDCRQLSFFFRYAFMTILGDSTLISAQSKKKSANHAVGTPFAIPKSFHLS